MIALEVVGYSLAAASFALLAALLLTRWRSRMRGSLLLPAVLVSLAWGVLNAAAPGDASLAALLLEVLRALAWTTFLTQVLGGFGARGLSRLLRFGPLLVALFALVLGSWTALAGGGLPSFLSLPRIVIASMLALGLFGFVLVEQVLRNTRAGRSWEVKYLWLGVGAFFAYDIALYSASYVLGDLARTLYAARGFAIALVVPLLALGVARVDSFRPQLLMSQRLAFYTTSAVIAGVYLLVVSIAGYYVRALGGSWGEALQVIVVFGALLGLATVLLSRAARARVRVLLAKHWLPYKYDYRTEWLDLTTRLTRDPAGSSLAQRTLDAFVRLAQVRGGGVLVLRDRAIEWVADSHFGNAGAPSEPADGAFCRFLEQNDWIVELGRARQGVGRDAEVPLPTWLAALTDAWLAIPLLHEGRLYALVVLGRRLAPDPLVWEDLDLLRAAARQAASYFALEHSAEALAREQQFAALNRLTAFLMHDLSNIVAQQRLIVENAARHKMNPAFIDDAVATIDHTVRRMTRLLDELRAESAVAPAPQRVELAGVCRQAVERMSDREPRPTLEIRDPAAAALIAGERLEHVVEHVIRNAQDATPGEGSVRVTLASDATHAVIDVTDSGRGMDAEFVRDRLFRPFDSTKGAKGMGIGAFQVREFVRAAGGEVSVRSAPGSGTSFVIRLPTVS